MLLRQAVRWFPTVLFLLGVAVFAARLPGLADGDWGRLATSALYHGWLPAVILVTSLSIRGRTTQHTVVAVFGGFFTAMFLARALGELAGEVMGADDPWRLAVVVPLLEEASKLVPILLVAAIWWGRRGSPGIVDHGLIGVASGAGFAFHEDGLWQRLIGQGFDGPTGWLLPQLHQGAAGGVIVGHAVWTGLVGLALGAALTRRERIWWLVAGATFAMVVFDHGSWNNLELREGWRFLLANGWLPAAVFLVGLALAHVVDLRALRSISAHVRVRPGEVPGYTIGGGEGGPFGRFRFAWRMVRISALAAHGAVRSPTRRPTHAADATPTQEVVA